MYKILVVDDEENIREVIKEYAELKVDYTKKFRDQNNASRIESKRKKKTVQE